MTKAEQPGLRDRKRAATRARIEAAALELVARDGLAAATVDAISERAEISPRTFFNYFETKDAAILGVRPEVLDAEDVARRLDAAGDLDPVDAVVGLVVSAMGVTGSDSDLHRRRMEVLREHPEILGSQFSQLDARRSRLTDHVARLLAHRGTFDDDADLAARAAIVFALCASAVRAVIDDRAGSPEAAAAATNETDENDAIERRAVDLIHSTLGRLA